ncbi:hypothetical protein EIN_469620 [Entamoeba invadens IP1]|uniref:Uncharacterized protein n=1 Tax=Entamoeba invadens IP1 TaxID=370355 RepID=A0A0A1TWL6_ENTIV|nr:hypothetical protein EIN_469620 [Entamoeba invadens IP1]ELP83748.1 hypothetical protein EIN_469620 [Entamoeba invadens IP1]|eukprot:XP_004183094.1 hypothetical protein EIN_469620 [Entamoeba invadens IP1]
MSKELFNLMTYSIFSLIQIAFTLLVMGLEIHIILFCRKTLYSEDAVFPQKYPLVYLYFSMIAALVFNIPSLLTGVLQSKIAAVFGIIFNVFEAVLLFIVYIITQIFENGISNISEKDDISSMERDANCCGWKRLKISGCNALHPENVKTSCYNLSAKPFLESVEYAADMDSYVIKLVWLLVCVTIVFMIFHKNQQKENIKAE